MTLGKVLKRIRKTKQIPQKEIVKVLKISKSTGNSKPKKILWKTVHPSYANPVRTYYLFRNQKYLENKYGKDAKKYIGVSLWKFFIKITLFEDRKREKYKMMMRGIRDSKKQVMGKYDEGRYK